MQQLSQHRTSRGGVLARGAAASRSMIRPTENADAAVGAVKGLAASGLFKSNSQEFFAAATTLAQTGYAATRA